MARVKCVMMQRDEKLLLTAWFRYYGYLFGFENLVVFDNGSVDPEVIETLKTFERAGSKILWEHNRVEDFHAKGSHFKNVIYQWDWEGGYDFALPLDCDEFLAVFTEHGLSCSKAEIHKCFDSLIGEEQALSFGWSFFNDLSSPGTFWPSRYPKSFLASDTVEDLDHGFHAASSRKKAGRRPTYFTYLHMHNKPFEMLLEHARRKLTLFTNPDNLDTLRAYDGPGLHLKQYFFMDEETYNRQSENKLLITVPKFSSLMAAFGVSNLLFRSPAAELESGEHDQVAVSFPVEAGQRREPTFFDGREYIARHSDVAQAKMPALLHFIDAGFSERRFPVQAFDKGSATGTEQV